MMGLLELDVTAAIDEVRRRKSEGEEISFFALVVKIIGDAIAENRSIHGIRAGRRKAVLFHDADIAVMVEKEVHGERVPLPLLVRSVNRKSAAEIYGEIRKAQNAGVEGQEDYVLGDSGIPGWLLRIYYLLPQRIRVSIMRRVAANPHRMKSLMGTAIVTSVGAAGHLSGWVVPKSMNNLCFALGPISKKPWVVANRVEVRDILHLTVLVDHDVVDGVPAARFIAKLAGRIQRRK
jgi:pyruvate/2-oxoglutarate dehydrogenase complex dihydrolipoamide acyltransferase (E2) component